MRGPGETSRDDWTEFSEDEEGEEARAEWARGYDELNGAPEGDWDR